jgi:hypothetical protein
VNINVKGTVGMCGTSVTADFFVAPSSFRNYANTAQCKGCIFVLLGGHPLFDFLNMEF